MLSKEVMEILRGMEEEKANELIEAYGDRAPQCYFCGHWNIEEKERGRDICKECGAEAKHGFGLGRWESDVESVMDDIKQSTSGLLEGDYSEFRELGIKIYELIDGYLEKCPLPCPECRETKSLKLENGRWICTKCGIKAPNKDVINPIGAWNMRRGRRDYGDGTTW